MGWYRPLVIDDIENYWWFENRCKILTHHRFLIAKTGSKIDPKPINYDWSTKPVKIDLMPAPCTYGHADGNERTTKNCALYRRTCRRNRTNHKEPQRTTTNRSEPQRTNVQQNEAGRNIIISIGFYFNSPTHRVVLLLQISAHCVVLCKTSVRKCN